MGDRPDADTYQALKVLRAMGVIRFAEGSRRAMEVAPGAPDAIPDGRGRCWASRVNLKYFGRKASMAASPAGGALAGKACAYRAAQRRRAGKG